MRVPLDFTQNFSNRVYLPFVEADENLVTKKVVKQ